MYVEEDIADPDVETIKAMTTPTVDYLLELMQLTDVDTVERYFYT